MNKICTILCHDKPVNNGFGVLDIYTSYYNCNFTFLLQVVANYFPYYFHKVWVWDTEVYE